MQISVQSHHVVTGIQSLRVLNRFSLNCISASFTLRAHVYVMQICDGDGGVDGDGDGAGDGGDDDDDDDEESSLPAVPRSHNHHICPMDPSFPK